MQDLSSLFQISEPGTKLKWDSWKGYFPRGGCEEKKLKGGKNKATLTFSVQVSSSFSNRHVDISFNTKYNLITIMRGPKMSTAHYKYTRTGLVSITASDNKLRHSGFNGNVNLN